MEQQDIDAAIASLAEKIDGLELTEAEAALLAIAVSDGNDVSGFGRDVTPGAFIATRLGALSLTGDELGLPVIGNRGTQRLTGDEVGYPVTDR